MDVDQEIPEDISEHLEVVEEEDEFIYTDDEDLDKDIDITPELPPDVNDGTNNDIERDKKNEDGIPNGAEHNDMDSGKALERDKNVTGGIPNDSGNSDVEVGKAFLDTVDKSTIALVQFSHGLAESILKEAVLISDIYNKDSCNVTSDDNIEGAKDKIRVVNRNIGSIGRKLPGAGSENGCDRYLLEKLLRSQPDIDETPVEYEGFNGDEAHLKVEPTADEKCVLAVSDKNNNQMDANTISMLSDNYLETIHEDTELVINQPEEIPEEIPEPIQEKSPRSEQKDERVEEKDMIKESTQDFKVDTETEKSEKAYFSDSSEDETEDEVDCCEMTHKEKKAVVKAVRNGDIDKVEILLEKRHADLDMLWFGENLLMIAINTDQESMAEFLIDNGIDLSYTGKLMERGEDGEMTLFTYTARDLAFDKGMDDIVEIIDYKTNNLFPFVKPKDREIRLRRPRPPTPSPTPEEDMDDDIFYDPETDTCLLRDPNEPEVNSEHRLTGSHKDRRSKLEHRSNTRTSVTSKFEDESVHTMPLISKHSESRSEFHDDISHVFGQDEGYETMSSVSPVQTIAHPKHKTIERNFLGTKDHVSVRGTRASHAMKVRNSSCKSRGSSTSSVEDYVMYPIQSTGSYNHESRRWHLPKSAPASRNYSVESIPDTVVRVGFPFVHGKARSQSASSKSDTRPRSQSARSNLSPYSQVARLLSESSLLRSTSSSPTSPVTHLPKVKKEPLVGRKDLGTSYTCIYANTTSSIPGRTIYSSPGTSSKIGYTDLRKQIKV